eukprot:1686118-Prymnesium_polylepis.1
MVFRGNTKTCAIRPQHAQKAQKNIEIVQRPPHGARSAHKSSRVRPRHKGKGGSRKLDLPRSHPWLERAPDGA